MSTLSGDQIQQMLMTMQQQMASMQALQSENQTLRDQNQALQTAPSGQSSHERAAKRDSPKRPTIQDDMDDSDWAIFEDSWRRYKRITRLETEEETIMELRTACSNEVNKLLFEFIGKATLDSTTMTEEILLGHIRSVAVKGVHKEVHRMNLGKITQSVGESITHYVARLKAQSLLCEFQITCSCNLSPSFAEEMVAQQLIAGLRNQDHQAKILGEATTLTTLQRK